MGTAADAFTAFYNIDEDKHENGAEMILGPNANGDLIVLTVAESGGPRHEAAQRKYARALEAARGKKEEFTRVWAKVIAAGILLSWENVFDNEGNTVEPTLEAREEALAANQRLLSDVIAFANDETNFKNVEAEDDTEGN